MKLFVKLCNRNVHANCFFVSSLSRSQFFNMLPVEFFTLYALIRAIVLCIAAVVSGGKLHESTDVVIGVWFNAVIVLCTTDDRR